MNWREKIFALILGVISLLVAWGIGAIIFGSLPLITIQEWLTSFYLFFSQGIGYLILGGIVVALFVLLALFFFRFLLPQKEPVITYHTPEGKVKISFDSIKTLSREAIKDVEAITEIDPQVERAGSSARVILNLKVKSLSSSIPELSNLVQSQVKQKIEEKTGITLKEVRLSVDLLSPQSSEEKEATSEVTAENPFTSDSETSQK